MCFMSADVTCEPHFHIEVYRIHNNFLHIGHRHRFEKDGKLAI
jgi:hypothetical protein